MKRRAFITLIGGAVAAWPQRALGQSDRRRVAVLTGLPAGDSLGQAEVAAFERGLKDLGWTATRNIQLEYRWPGSDFDRLRAAAKELLAWNPDVIIARATPSVAAIRRETIVIPIVFIQVADPLGAGFVESLARPGNNITGFTNFEASLGGKWIELLKEMAPQVTRVAVLFNPETAPFAKIFLQTIDTAGPSLGIEPFTAPTRDVAGIERACYGRARAGRRLCTDT
jgi:putative ABC transport system substrate-binding protein